MSGSSHFFNKRESKSGSELIRYHAEYGYYSLKWNVLSQTWATLLARYVSCSVKTHNPFVTGMMWLNIWDITTPI